MLRPPLRLLAAALTLLTLWLGAGFAGASTELPAPGRFPHAAFTEVLARFVDAGGRVDYAGLRQDRGGLDAYTAHLRATSPKRHPELFPTRQDQLAYWLNAYNAYAITGVIDAPGLRSVHDRFVRFFFVRTWSLGGRRMSLHRLENEIIRREFGDPRVHVALNCQSVGCPVLPRHAFSPETLDAELDAAAAGFCADPAKVAADPDAQLIRMSQIFEWFAEDFAVAGGPIGFCNSHGQRFDPTWPITYIPYDWALIAQPGRGP